jgi:A/G-specific adenine glycosylase
VATGQGTGRHYYFSYSLTTAIQIISGNNRVFRTLARKLSENLVSFTVDMQHFNRQLAYWFSQHHRPLPWKGEKDPYIIWLSEVILQQTRVEQGLPYFEHFKENYPTVHHLAQATTDQVMKSWQGLGYYSRARNMHHAAKYISKDLGGVFPNTYQSILALKGVGPYTAAAIASFAYELPNAVVDGNVFRVLSRYFNISTPIDSTQGKKQFSNLAQKILESSEMTPSAHNQAMMDFGATMCVARNPKCGDCPLKDACKAYRDDLVEQLPVKSKKLKKKVRFFNYLVIKSTCELLLDKREEKDIWQQLYQFPLLEMSDAVQSEQTIRASSIWKTIFGSENVVISRMAGPYSQVLSHQRIRATFWEVEVENVKKLNYSNYQVVELKNLSKFAFPKIIDCYFQDKSLYLKLL